MHAASVHPEPGSNSLIFSIDRPFGLPYQCLFLEPFGSCSLTCKSLFIFSSQEFSESLYVFFQGIRLRISLSKHRCLCCSIFKDPAASPDSLFIISHHPSLVNTFFLFIFLCQSCTTYLSFLTTPHMQISHLNTLPNTSRSLLSPSLLLLYI